MKRPSAIARFSGGEKSFEAFKVWAPMAKPVQIEVWNPNGKYRVVSTKPMPGTRWINLLIEQDCRVEVISLSFRLFLLLGGNFHVDWTFLDSFSCCRFVLRRKRYSRLRILLLSSAISATASLDRYFNLIVLLFVDQKVLCILDSLNFESNRMKYRFVEETREGNLISM